MICGYPHSAAPQPKPSRSVTSIDNASFNPDLVLNRPVSLFICNIEESLIMLLLSFNVHTLLICYLSGKKHHDRPLNDGQQKRKPRAQPRVERGTSRSLEWKSQSENRNH